MIVVEEEKVVRRVASILGFNITNERTNLTTVRESIRTNIEPALWAFSGIKYVSFNRETRALTRPAGRDKDIPIINERTNNIEYMYAWNLPDNYGGFIKDNGDSRDIQGKFLYSNLETGLVMTYNKVCKLSDVNTSTFEYFCHVVALMTAPSVGEDARVPMINENRARYLRLAVTANKVRTGVNVTKINGINRW